jgi:hypothetical protein
MMSHIVEAKTTIQNPNRELLGQAVQLVAQQHRGYILDKYHDYFERTHTVSTGLAIYTPNLTRGMGVEIKESGELTFVGDPWRVQNLFEQLQQEIVQIYVALASMQALQQLGYSTQAIDGQNREVVIQGVAYA